MSIPIYRAPILDLKSKRRVEIPFTGLVGAGVQLTLVSNMITYPFKVIQAKMLFGRNAQNLIQHFWLYAGEDSTSTTALPSGFNIFSRETPTGSFRGESLVRVVNTSIEIVDERQFIKLHTVNGIGVAYYINASIMIEEL